MPVPPGRTLVHSVSHQFMTAEYELISQSLGERETPLYLMERITELSAKAHWILKKLSLEHKGSRCLKIDNAHPVVAKAINCEGNWDGNSDKQNLNFTFIHPFSKRHGVPSTYREMQH